MTLAAEVVTAMVAVPKGASSRPGAAAAQAVEALVVATLLLLLLVVVVVAAAAALAVATPAVGLLWGWQLQKMWRRFCWSRQVP